jgi:hypothetical protein
MEASVVSAYSVPAVPADPWNDRGVWSVTITLAYCYRRQSGLVCENVRAQIGGSDQIVSNGLNFFALLPRHMVLPKHFPDITRGYFESASKRGL